MLHLPLEKIKPGMVTAQNIYNDRGVNYLTSGIPMTELYLERLRELGIGSLTVFSTETEEKSASNINLPRDILDKKTRTEALRNLRDIFDDVNRKKTINISLLQGSAQHILDDILMHQRDLVQLSDVRQHDTYTFAHSVNVAVLSALLGVSLGYSKGNLITLILGGLLHDIGKVIVPKEILNKPGHLTKEEFAIIRMHPSAGRAQIDLIKDEPRKHLLGLIAEQHHEHIDGRGYPFGLKADKIAQLARVVAIADVYDALTSQRSYKDPYPPHIAYNIMKNLTVGQFDQSMLELFFQNVAVYPITTVMETTVGIGIVKKVHFGKTLRPDICVFAERKGEFLKEPFMMELSEEPGVDILRVLNDDELLAFIEKKGVDPFVFLAENYPLRSYSAGKII
ncbi:MAG: HD domain-containing protein [Schwartzia sp.]|nr:HD domain-containing protein [Schwartzia sp. (in: firmicutes)]MDY6295358.1 HD domain-containing protein [Schwartzia succinivorans]